MVKEKKARSTIVNQLKKVHKYGVLLVLLFSAQFVHATTIKLEAPDLPVVNNMPTVNVGESFRLQVLVSHDRRDAEDVHVRGLGNLAVQGTSQMTNVSVVNNQMVAQKTYEYDVVADKKGVITVGPAVTHEHKKEILSNTLTINVVDLPVAQRQKGPDAHSAEKPNVYSQLEVSKKEIVVGEPLEVTLKIFMQGPIIEIGATPPTFKGFFVKELDKDYLRGKGSLGNQEYDVLRRRYVLVPMDKGVKHIEPVQVAYTFSEQNKGRQPRNSMFAERFFDDFFSRSRVTQQRIRSEELEINVTDLPPTTKRVDGVGVFTEFRATLDKEQAALNEPVVLKIELVGKGNVEQIADMRLSLPAGVKSYKSKTAVHDDVTPAAYNGSRKTFEYIVQVPFAGPVTIPAQHFVYFDTQSRTYKTMSTQPVSVTIAPGPDGAASAPTTQPQQERGKQSEKKADATSYDIHYIEEDAPIGNHDRAALPWWAFLLLLLILALLLKSSFFAAPFARLFRALFGVRLKRNALAKFEKELDSLVKKRRAVDLHRFFVDFLAAKYECDVHAINEEWIARQLGQDEWNKGKIDEFLHYLSECASLYFAAKKGVADAAKLLKNAKYWFLILHK
ncbi:BatD family protein [Candidatus Babeliales bacterium]|nr:BatD family protein [Candidatus Babeliales bacterium]